LTDQKEIQTQPGDSILELRSITKLFPGVKALDSVQFDLKPGEIHGLMGENGAGKSTFIKVITGVHSPDEGEMILYGQPVHFSTPLDAQRSGVAAIYQHVTCYPDLTVAENIFMGHEKLRKLTRTIDWQTMHEEAQQLLSQLDANFDSYQVMGELSVAQQQIVEIAKALSTNAKIVIMDEPTAALTQHESEELYRITEGLRDDGVSVIFISHRMEDIYRLADRITVFRDAKYIGTWNAKELTQDKLIVAMVGREITQLFPKRKNVIGDEILKVEGLGRTGFFKDVSFSVRKGEIVALTGLVGAGRTEVAESIFGIHPSDEGTIFFEGKKITITNPIQALKVGIGCLPEDRQKQGLVLEWEIGKNISLSTIENYCRRSWIDQTKERKVAGSFAEKLKVKAPSIFTKASALSGGNQQKVVIAKILTNDLKLIILDEPTKGVDIGAKMAIYQIIEQLAEQGYGIVLISSEMPEVLGLSDRIVVMKSGRVTAELDTEHATQEQILHAAMVVQTPGEKMLAEEFKGASGE
jgi:rhamnose transport system ATP-binding protein